MTTLAERSMLAGEAIAARLDELGRISDEPQRLTRLTLSPSHRRAVDLVALWMREAGMTVRVDATGSVVGRYEAANSGSKPGSMPGAKTLLVGSHIDTVRNAGQYDGNLGVVVGVAAVAELSRRGVRLPYAIEVIAFADEEGVRFPSSLTSSRAVAGVFDPASLDDVDADGVTRRDALRAFGCDPGAIAAEARDPAQVAGYLEVHIEQGPVLESEGLPVGVVTAINGATRGEINVRGVAGHSGTLPMSMRADALAAAARMIIEIEAIALSDRDLVATNGRIETPTGAVNIVPGHVRMSLDVRSPDDDKRHGAVERIRAAVARIAAERGVEASLDISYDMPATPCDPRMMDTIAAAMTQAGHEPYRLGSGAGHDGLSFRGRIPIGMIFVRCRKGISHNPAEYASPQDIGVAAQVLYNALTLVGATT